MRALAGVNLVPKSAISLMLRIFKVVATDAKYAPRLTLPIGYAFQKAAQRACPDRPAPKLLSELRNKRAEKVRTTHPTFLVYCGRFGLGKVFLAAFCG